MGDNVVVQPVNETTGTSPVTITFSEVTEAGTTSLTITDSGPTPPTGFKLGNPPTYYDLTTTADFTGSIEVCVTYDETQFNGPEGNLKLFHRNVGFADVTTSLDTVNNIICGGVASLSLFVVAKENTPPTIVTFTGDSLVVEVGGSVNFTATFTDPDGDDIHITTFDFGDGSPPIVGASLIASHPYTETGVYLATLTVVDDVGGVDSESLLVSVFDPSAGFVTGGGWIDSPEGACELAACTFDTTGRAILGFVSKYKKGANVPTGQTVFQFKAGDLNFHSTYYEWLVVAGARAQEGTINGAGNYGFLLTAIDGALPGGGGSDRFRIKIRDIGNGGEVVYGNKRGSLDNSDDATALGGGSIKIHEK